MKTNFLGKGLSLCVGALLTVVFSNVYASSGGGYGLPSLPAPAELTPEQALGKLIFFDENLSEPAGQSCASCHMPNAGFSDPDTHLPVSEGVIPDRFGHRNAQTAAYASFSPAFSYDTSTSIAVGGQFWDGRRADLAAQAKDPFLNSFEMNNPDKSSVIIDIQNSSYASMFEEICGPINDVNAAYDCMSEAIAAYERSSELNPFTSKFDYVLAGFARFTEQEAEGMALFNSTAMCSQCHTSTIVMTDDRSGENMVHNRHLSYSEQCGESRHHGRHHGKHQHDKGDREKGHHRHRHNSGGCGSSIPASSAPILFTDFQYYNLGLPRNTEFPFRDLSSSSGICIEALFSPEGSCPSQESYNPALSQVDLGLGSVLKIASENGRFKVPTLRNVELTAPYMHNGVLKTLKEVVRFYNLRNTGEWGLPEVIQNVEQRRMGNLGLSSVQEDAIVAFLLTLTDGYAVDSNGGYGQKYSDKKHKYNDRKYKKHAKKYFKKHAKRYFENRSGELSKKYAKRYAKEYADRYSEEYANRYSEGYVNKYAEKYAKKYGKKYAKKYAEKREEDDDYEKYSKKHKHDDDDD